MAPPDDAALPAPRGVWTIVVAGGGGRRFGAAKQYEALAGRTVLDWSVDVAAASTDGVVVVVPAGDIDRPVPGADRVVAGGGTRSASVRLGLEAVPDDVGTVLVHDAARPAASTALFERVVAAVGAGADGAVPAVPVTDSLRTTSGAAVDRERLVAVQTPQGFRAAVLRSAHADGAEASDDATLVERVGGTIVVVEGEVTNTKLTHPHDRVQIEQVLVDRSGTSTDGGAS